jgi:short-subunit dehydrogenase
MTTTNILITGASGGIGAALARAYAGAGVHLVLWGRNVERLDQTASECRERGASVETAILDLQDVPAMTARLRETDARTPLSLAILNAGLGGAVTHQLVDTPERALQVANLDFTATAVGAIALSSAMAERGRGHIIIVGSVSDGFPLPMAPVYVGAKAGLAMFADALRLRVAKAGVGVTLVAPGFIDTDMSRSLTTPRPFLMTADAAAELIKRKAKPSRRRLVFPWQFVVLQALPRALVRAVLRKI